MTTIEPPQERFGGAFLLADAPDSQLPEYGMSSTDAMRLIGEELLLEGNPMRNLATFVTTWMEPEAQRIIAENLHRNYIDHAEYPQTALIEQRCVRMLADLFHAPGETTGTRTQGSSEAIMLGALSLKWKWRERREAAGKPTDRPNLVFGGDVHVVWEKFCRYFDVEPRIIPLRPDHYTIGPEDVEPHVDENTIGVAAVLGTTFTGHADDIPGINNLLVRLQEELYEFEACPFCRKVREALTALDLDAIVYPCPRGGRYREVVKEKGGKLMFPYLVDPNTGRAMYESNDIVTYLSETYGAGVPLLLRLGPITDVTSFAASAWRPGRGRKARPNRAPAKPLELWSFEASPFCRIAREALCELEVPYHLHNVGKGGAGRAAFREMSGRMMVPYLKDPNTGAAMFESGDIVAYLNQTYGG